LRLVREAAGFDQCSSGRNFKKAYQAWCTVLAKLAANVAELVWGRRGE